MKNYKKKKIVPIVITVLMILYFTLYFSILIYFISSILIKVILAIIPLILGGIMIFVCIERMKEIDGGEEDDLSKY